MSLQPPASGVHPSEDAVLEVLRTAAADALEMPPDEIARIGPATPIVEGLRLDSLRQVVLLTRIEEDLGFEFDQSELAALGADATVGALVQLIARRAADARRA